MARFGGEAKYLIGADGTILSVGELGLELTGDSDIPAQYQETRGYQQHGVTVRGWQLQARTLSFKFREDVRSRRALLEARARLLETLSPESGIVTFRQVLPDGERRDIDGWLQAGLALKESTDRLSFDADFTLRCPDPSFYDPQQISVQLEAGYPNALVFPFVFSTGAANDFYFDDAGIARSSISYDGSWRSYPVIVITGPYQTVTVKNVTTGASFTLGVAILTGEAVLVDLTPGRLRIVDANGNSLLDHRTGGTFTGWYLQPGLNDVQVTGSGTGSTTTFTLSYNRRFIGL